MVNERDRKYLDIILTPIRVCADYKPKMGKRDQNPLDLDGFQRLYRADPFYNWFGLYNPLMYTAHRAAGGMTSIYRQLGIGGENLFREIIMDGLGLTREQANWSYTSETGGKPRTLKLDGRIQFDHVADQDKRNKIKSWVRSVAGTMNVDPGIAGSLKGVVFEVRQGYKSKDSKRQNADLANAHAAYTRGGYLPCMLLLSTQIDEDIVIRYRSENYALLVGSISNSSPTTSTYDFMREVIGYDLAGFFERHSNTLKEEVERILKLLLCGDNES